MNRFLTASVLCCGLVLGATCVRAEGDAVATTNKTVTAGKAQTLCPVMKEPIDKNVYVDVEGKRIYCCCPGCIAKVKKAPQKYIQQMEADGIVLENAPAAPAKSK